MYECDATVSFTHERSAVVRKCHGYERPGSPTYGNLVRAKYSGFTVSDNFHFDVISILGIS